MGLSKVNIEVDKGPYIDTASFKLAVEQHPHFLLYP
jgi:hypothetical protein